MRRKSEIPVEKKIEAVEDYLNGRRCTSQVLHALQINKNSFHSWVRKYNLFGKEGLITNNYNRHYSEQLKTEAVRDYLNGVGSQIEICKKYRIPNHSLLQLWIKKYNSHEMFRSQNVKGDRSMTKGRKTTYEERNEIVAFCIEHNNNYHLTADKFKVSYQQVYTWVKKYKAQGYDALFDGRGRCKGQEELSESEKYVAQLKLLEAENRRLKMENDFLKKLKEVERRR